MTSKQLEQKKRKNSLPTYQQLVDVDLVNKKKENPKLFKKVFKILRKIYQCRLIDLDSIDYNKLQFKFGLPIEIVLKLLKWMFIKEDLEHWQGTGRNKLWEGICQQLT